MTVQRSELEPKTKFFEGNYISSDEQILMMLASAVFQEMIDNWTIEHGMPIDKLRSDALTLASSVIPYDRRALIAWLVRERLTGKPYTRTGLVDLVSADSDSGGLDEHQISNS